MSALSSVDLARLIGAGNDSIPAFGAKLSADAVWAITDYLRSLSFSTAALAQPATAPANQTSVAADIGTASAEGTPVGTEQATTGSEATPIVKAGFGTIKGSIVNKVSAGLPSDLTISLHGFDHSAADPTAGPQEVLTQAGTVNMDGTYTFNNIEIHEGRIFLVEVDYSGINLKSDYGVVEAGKTTVTIPTLTLYESSQDASKLIIDELHMFLQPNGDTAIEALALYNFRNTSDKMIMVNMGSNQEIPFLKFMTGAEPLGYQAIQDSAPIISTSTRVSTNAFLIGAGGLGLALILSGVWLYWRDRQRGLAIDEEDTEDDEEFESSEEVMDAIIALDDLHRAKKIAEEVYQKRRGELKEVLKGMM